MPEGCTTEQYKKLRHDAVVFLEAHPKWAGAKKALGNLRKATRVADEEVLNEAIRKSNAEHYAEHGVALIPDASHWSFHEYSRELYQLISVKLNSSTFSDLKDEEGMNGLELWRQLEKSKDPIRVDVGFHLELAIQAMAHHRESSFDATYARFIEIDKASKNFKAVTGEPANKAMLARVLYAVLDEKTADEVDKADDIPDKMNPEFYDKFKDWIIEKMEKHQGRSAIRAYQRPKNNGSNAMQVGALAGDTRTAAEAQGGQAATPCDDQWWQAGMEGGYWDCQPCEGEDSQWGGSWGQGGDIGAFKKGGGKGPMECYNCKGLNHPARMCPSPVGVAHSGMKCSCCGGFGHMAKDCVSPGGGKFSGGKGMGGKLGGGKGKGNNASGKGKGGKGRG